MLTIRSLLAGLATFALVAAAVPVAQAAPDLAGSVTIDEPNGFPGICDQPCFTVTKYYEVYYEGNPPPAGIPAPGPGVTTYVYKLTHTGGTGTPIDPFGQGWPIGFVPSLFRFEVGTDTSFTTAAGFIAADPGVAPSLTSIDAFAVRWDFDSPMIQPPPPWGPGGTADVSKRLYIQSTLWPGSAPQDLVAVSVDGQLALDAPGACVGPAVEPSVEPGEAMPCTIGFWKNRSVGKDGLLQFFPDPYFDALVTSAVALCDPVFADEADLLTNLQSKGKRSILIRAKQQLAAFCLNLAAGDMFPDNQKCKLFEGNYIETNACGDDLLVGDALTQSISDVGSGDPLLEHDAHECADDVNNGISVFDGPPSP